MNPPSQPSTATSPNTPNTPDTASSPSVDAGRIATSQRDATTLQSPAVSREEPPPGSDGGTRTRTGSNYGDWVPDKREPDHPDIRHPEELPLVPPPQDGGPLQGEFERGDNDPLVK